VLLAPTQQHERERRTHRAHRVRVHDGERRPGRGECRHTHRRRPRLLLVASAVVATVAAATAVAAAVTAEQAHGGRDGPHLSLLGLRLANSRLARRRSLVE
jgi:hypothetical protein